MNVVATDPKAEMRTSPATSPLAVARSDSISLTRSNTLAELATKLSPASVSLTPRPERSKSYDIGFDQSLDGNKAVLSLTAWSQIVRLPAPAQLAPQQRLGQRGQQAIRRQGQALPQVHARSNRCW